MGRKRTASASSHAVPACLSSNPGHEQCATMNLVRTLTTPAQFFNILRLGKHDNTNGNSQMFSDNITMPNPIRNASLRYNTHYTTASYHCESGKFHHCQHLRKSTKKIDQLL